MSLKDVDLGSALRRLADMRIEEAMAEGKFDNLPGAGQELVLDDMPADENARLTRWCIRILRKNDVVPEEVRWRKLIDHLRAMLDTLTDERKLSDIVGQINALVYKVNTLGTNALKSPVAAACVETERRRLRDRICQK